MGKVFKISILFLMIGFKSYSFESYNAVKGIVTNSGKGVPYVAVYLNGTNNGSITDADGNFSIDVPANAEVVLSVKGLGYKSVYKKVNPDDFNSNIQIDIGEDYLLLEQVVISGSRVGILRFLPGSAKIVSQRELDITSPISGNEVFRNVPGINVVEEEGAGLRLNVGIRGLDPDKSRNVLILEDGIPVALAPYGEPEMYYTPSIDRMSGVEILKGNGSILFGPQTIGGVINYLTADAPSELEGKASLWAGDKGFYNAKINFGNTIDNFGYTLNLQRKQAENFGPTEFLFHDINSKFITSFSEKSSAIIKLGYYNENSNSTYVGLTQPMFDSGIMDDLRIAPEDNLNIKRYSVGLIHKYNSGDNLQINTTAFAYTTERNWKRQDFTNNASASNLTGIWHGFEDEPDGAIYMRNSTGHRNRKFEVAGIEPRLSYQFNVANMISKTDAGVRFLHEKAYEQRIDGTNALYSSGNLRDDEIRIGNTASGFLQNMLLFNEKLSFTAGVRSENIWYEREIMRRNFKDTLLTANSSVFALIPGAGINYNISKNIGFFTGIHRGFAPPRIKDAISNEGQDLQLDAEKSWNFELGTRINIKGFALEYTLFHMDFSNQVIPVSESSGGLGSGYINGGETLHKGMELSLLIPFDYWLPENWSVNAIGSATYTDSRFSSDRYVLYKKSQNTNSPDEYINVNGNKTPYAPDLTIFGALNIEHSLGFGFRLSSNYIGKQYTDVLNTDDVYHWIQVDNNDEDYKYVQATANGRIGLLEAYNIINASVWYNHAKTGLGINIGVKNLTDERYIATRRPQGIRAGLPRMITARISYSF
ncbi:MAG: TonB-dependent receptor [Bacteroidetes bacterium]|nr:TonB-dependent receptor [Bacteroidota bacterium]